MTLSFSVLLRTFHRSCSCLGDFCWQCFTILLSLLISASLYTYTVRLLAVVLALFSNVASTCWFLHSYVGRPVRTLYSNVPETYWLPYSYVDDSVHTLYSNVPETYWLPYSYVTARSVLSIQTFLKLIDCLIYTSTTRSVLFIQTSLKLIDCLIYTSTTRSVLFIQTSLDLNASIDWLRHRSISIEMQKSIDYVIVLLKRPYRPIYY